MKKKGQLSPRQAAADMEQEERENHAYAAHTAPPEEESAAQPAQEAMDRVLKLPLYAQVQLLRSLAPMILGSLAAPDQQEVLDEIHHRTLQASHGRAPDEGRPALH
ncbi:MAG: hypothetical protein AB2A00_22340 [Myxococcota bacterium]